MKWGSWERWRVKLLGLDSKRESREGVRYVWLWITKDIELIANGLSLTFVVRWFKVCFKSSLSQQRCCFSKDVVICQTLSHVFDAVSMWLTELSQIMALKHHVRVCLVSHDLPHTAFLVTNCCWATNVYLDMRSTRILLNFLPTWGQHLQRKSFN